MSGRLVDSQLLQVMSPKMHSNQDVDVPMEQVGIGPQVGQIDIVTRMIVTPADVVAAREGSLNPTGAALATSQSHPLSDTPVKAHHLNEVGEYKEALRQSHTRATEEIHEFEVDAASKVKALLKSQRDGFEQTASEYKETARAIAAREVAEERAKIHTEANTALSSRELQLKLRPISFVKLMTFWPMPKRRTFLKQHIRIRSLRKLRLLFAKLRLRLSS